MGIAFIKLIWVSVQLLIGYNLVLPIMIFIVYIFRSSRKLQKKVNGNADYAIIVTAYEQTHTLGPVVASLLKLNYPNYLIYIVADKCDISSLNFNSEKVVLLRPEETLSSNTRSHFYAIDRFLRQHDRLTIIESLF